MRSTALRVQAVLGEGAEGVGDGGGGECECEVEGAETVLGHAMVAAGVGMAWSRLRCAW